jgi:arginine deiminase
MTLHVDSEVGRHRQAILHRPDLELKRLTPTNHDEYLFDDVLWIKHAKQEHDAFAEALRDLDVEVHLLDRLLSETVAIHEAKKFVLEESLDERVYGPMAMDSLHSCFESLDPAELTEYLIGGMTKRELLERVPEPSSVVVQALQMDDHLLQAPLPNYMFTRDTSAWIYDGSPSTRCASGPGPGRRSTTRRSTAGTPTSPAQRSTSGQKVRPTAWPPPRGETSWCSAGEPSSWG